MKNFFKILALASFIAPGFQLKTQAATPLSTRQAYIDLQREVRQLGDNIDVLNTKIAHGEKVENWTWIIAGTALVVSVVGGIAMFRSGNGAGSNGCGAALLGTIFGGIGTIVSVGGGLVYSALNKNELNELRHQVELRKQELSFKIAATDSYLKDHPELNQPLSPEEKSRALYDESLRNVADLQAAITSLEADLAKHQQISNKSIMIGSAAVLVTFAAGKWVFSAKSMGFWGFIGKIGSYSASVLSGAAGTAYWYFNHKEIADIKTQLANRAQELRLQKAAVESYLRISPELQAKPQKP